MINQQIIDLFDEYTHGTMTRSDFLKKLAILAGSSAAAASLLPKLELDFSHSQTSSMEGEYIAYPSGEEKVKAYLSVPEGEGPFGAVMVVHENKGLNPHIEDVTRRVAAAGFIGMAPDALSGQGGTPEDQDEARTLIRQLDYEQTVQQFLDGLKYLRTLERSNGKTGVTGFCWGGAMTNQMAVHDPELLAAASFYGRQPKAEEVTKIKCSLMLHYGGLDTRINEGIPAFEEALKDAGTDYQLFIYEDVNHAFHNDTAPTRYNEKAAKLAWGRTMELFEEKLG